MAIIHRTTLTPGKLELLAAWLPGQPWYRGDGRPELSKAGGFRLDDPAGEVGLEFMVVNDQSADDLVTYHVPVTYRAAPLAGADEGLIGTSEHGVLGRRWVYDGAHDPVLVGRLLDLLNGHAQPQAQSESNTPDPSVIVDPVGADAFSVSGTAVAVSGTAVAGHLAADGDAGPTDITVEAAGGAEAQLRVIRLIRVLHPAPEYPGPDLLLRSACVTAPWNLPDGSVARGPFAVIKGNVIKGKGEGI